MFIAILKLNGVSAFLTTILEVDENIVISDMEIKLINNELLDCIDELEK